MRSSLAVTTWGTAAERRARELADSMVSDRITVSVDLTETSATRFSDGRIMLDGYVTAQLRAYDGYGGYFTASWITRTTGSRRSTKFSHGCREYGSIKVKGTKFSGPRQAYQYASMFTG